jgi:hypothetical protein
LDAVRKSRELSEKAVKLVEEMQELADEARIHWLQQTQNHNWMVLLTARADALARMEILENADRQAETIAASSSSSHARSRSRSRGEHHGLERAEHHSQPR